MHWVNAIAILTGNIISCQLGRWSMRREIKSKAKNLAPFSWFCVRCGIAIKANEPGLVMRFIEMHEAKHKEE